MIPRFFKRSMNFCVFLTLYFRVWSVSYIRFCLSRQRRYLVISQIDLSSLQHISLRNPNYVLKNIDKELIEQVENHIALVHDVRGLQKLCGDLSRSKDTPLDHCILLLSQWGPNTISCNARDCIEINKTKYHSST